MFVNIFDRVYHGADGVDQGSLEMRYCRVTEYGASGPYQIGVEYTIDADRIHHLVRRPLRREEFLGYGRHNGVGTAVTRVAHDGLASEWRIWSGNRVAEPIERPISPPLLSLPGEEHGHQWGDPVDLGPSEEPRYFWAGEEITAGAAYAAIAAYKTDQSGAS